MRKGLFGLGVLLLVGSPFLVLISPELSVWIVLGMASGIMGFCFVAAGFSTSTVTPNMEGDQNRNRDLGPFTGKES